MTNKSNNQDCSRDDNFLRLLMSNQDKIYAFILSLVHNSSDADDIMQDTITVMWRKYDSFQQGTSFIAWGISIARILVLKFFEKNRHSKLSFSPDLEKELCLITTEKLTSEIQDSEGPDVLSADLWRYLAEFEKTAPTLETADEKPARELIQKVVYLPREKTRLTKLHKFTLAACAAVIVFFAYLYYVPQKPSSVDVATIIDQINAQWGQTNPAVNNGDRLFSNAGPLDLKKGAVKIHYDEGVDVVIEGPATFELERSGIYLEYGRLYSRVSETGLGFRVVTPTSQFIDQGTEFGVQADVNGASELHVIKGKVQLFAGNQGSSKVSQLITENNAIRYDANSEKLQKIPVQKKAFIRQVNSKTGILWHGESQLSLADIVGGGTGLGRRPEKAELPPDTLKQEMNGAYPTYYKTGDGQYYTEPHPYIDGVFVPDKGDGCQVVSSLGHEFIDCPDTSNRYRRGVTTYLHPHFSNYDMYPGKMTEYLNVESDSMRPMLSIYSNLGITFDLEKIREDMPGLALRRFRAMAGIPETIATKVNSDATVWVLVDGKTRFKRENVTIDSFFEIVTELGPNDRFLSLVVTEGTMLDVDSEASMNHLDLCVLADPVLDLE